LRAQIQPCRPVSRFSHLKARWANNSLCGRSRITTRRCDAISDGRSAEWSHRCHTSGIANCVAIPSGAARAHGATVVLATCLERFLHARPAGTARKPSHSVKNTNGVCASPIPHLSAVPLTLRTRFVQYARARRSGAPYALAERRSCGSVRAITSMR